MIADSETSVAFAGETDLAIRRATYFEAIAHPSDGWSVTEQAAVEMAHLALRDGQRPRQATRYGLHGIHEYKGKFNPQVVRALCNIADPEAEVLIDPFCGSGTALIEGLRLGMDVVGIDHSPIACYIADAKLSATAADSKRVLGEELLRLGERCADAIKRGQATADPPDITDGLGAAAETYLEHWFTPPAWAGLSSALALLSGAKDSVARRLVLIALSSILRKVSLQLPEDLRIRRRPEPFIAPPMAPLFLEAIDGIRRGLLEMEDWPAVANRWTVCHTTAEDEQAYDAAGGPNRRLILTSPPYATALPYIDTDRLSVVALGLAESADLQSLERSLIGSREWIRAEQLEWDARRVANADNLPGPVESIVGQIHKQNERSGAGFRRKAVPSLLYRYFARMGDALSRWRRVLAPGECAVLIVGHNHTTAGGRRIDIPTPELLGDVSETRGFAVTEIVKLETWPRYGLHAANGVPGEDALVLRRAS